MKKILLLSAVAFAATVSAREVNFSTVSQARMSAAQKLAEMSAVAEENNQMVAPSAAELVSLEAASKASAAAETVLYARPAGSVYYNWDMKGSGYGPTYVVAPAFDDFTYKNLSTNPATTQWHSNGSSFVDFTEYKEENGDMIWSINPGYYSAALTVTNAAATDSFCIGKTTNTYWSQNASYFTRVSNTIDREVANLGFVDDHVGQYGWGSVSTRFLYGSGTLSGYPVVGVEHSYAKPARPLYIEDFYIRGKSASATALHPNDTLTMVISNTETEEIIAVLTCDSTMVIPGTTYAVEYTTTGSYTLQTAVFMQIAYDELSQEYVAEPFVIDCPFTVTIFGLDGEGVDFGINGVDYLPEDVENSTACSRTLMIVDAGGSMKAMGYTAMSMLISFEGYFLGIGVEPNFEYQGKVLDYANFAVVSNDGAECKSMLFSNIKGVKVTTQQLWHESVLNNTTYMYEPVEGGDEYIYAELPEWVLSMTATPMGDYDCTYDVTFTAEQLPEGTEYRWAEIWLEDFGVKADAPIYLIQGDADKAYAEIKATGIKALTNAAEMAAKTYNMYGQEVAADAKGLVISNGVKSIRK